MKKKILTLLISVITCITISASYTQQVEITIDKGLSCNAVRSFARDYYGRLWVGTTNGANLISNGTIRQYQYFTIGKDDIVAGDVISIGCSKRAIIATTNYIIDFDPDNDSTRLVTFEGKSLRTEYIMMNGDSAYFYNMPLSAVMVYDLNTGTTSMVAQFPSERQFHFTKLLQVSSDPNQILLVEDDRGIYHLNTTTGILSHMDSLGYGMVSRSVFIDSKDILWIAYKESGITGYYVKSGFDMIAHYDASVSDLFKDAITCLVEMPDGNLLVCTGAHGLSILNRKTGKIDNSLLGKIDPLHVLCAQGNP